MNLILKNNIKLIYLPLNNIMKNLIITLIIIATISFSFKSYEDYMKTDARVNQAEGLLIFMESTPLREYEVLGTVKKTGLTWTGGLPQELFRIILRRAKRDYPNSDAVIFDDIEMKHATCIKFK